MKKLFTTLLFLMAGILFVGAQTGTKTLKIGDVSIDLTKNGSYTNIGSNNGTATYKVSEKRLYLKNVMLQNKMISGTNLSDATYYISLESDLKMQHSSGMCMRFDKSTVVFEGNGHDLFLDGSPFASSGHSTFDAEDSDISFWNVFLTVYAGGSNAFYGSSSKGKISFSRVYGAFYSKSGAAFKGFKSMSFDDCLFNNPTVKFVSGTGVTSTPDGSLMSLVDVMPYLRFGKNIIRTVSDNASGTGWSWVKSTKTLTLTNVDSKTESLSAIENYGVDGLTLKIEGSCKLTSNRDAISSTKSMTISGDGANTTNLTMTAQTGIETSNSVYNSLTINKINIKIDAKSYGIAGNIQSTLSINNSSLTVSGQSSGSIAYFKSCTMTDCDVDAAQNPDVCFRKMYDSFSTPSEIYKNTIYIKTLSSDDKYNLYVLGHQVNKLNKSRVAVDGLTEGTMSFDNSTNVMRLSKVKMESPTGNTESGIKSYISDFQVELVGDNTVTTDGDAIYVGFNGRISGSGSLTAVSKGGDGLSFVGYYMTISVNNTVRFKGKRYGCVANNASGKEFTLKKADTKSDYYFSGEEQALRVYYDLVLTDMDFYYSSNYGTPGCYFDKSQHCVVQNGGTPVSGNNEVNFFNINSGYPRYDLYVGGTQVTACNKYGIGSRYITAGGPTAVTYDHTTKTLTLTDATVTNKGEEMNALKNSGVDGLTINVVGNNTLLNEDSGWNSSNTSVNLSANTTITGNGTLNVKGAGALYVTDGNKLTFKDAKKVVVERAIRSNGPTSKAELVVDNSNVESGYVCYWKSVTWLNGSLAEPVNGKFDPTSTYIVDANGNHASKVVFIDQAATAIDAVEVDRNADVRNIYDASGRQTDSARKGLNIIRMSDGTVRKVMVK